MRPDKGAKRPVQGFSRIDIIDALRGLAIILMVIYHGLYDVVYYLDAPEWLFRNPVFDFLNRFFEVLFILLSGVSCRLSRSNFKRGLLFWGGAIAVSVTTHLINNPIRFGILHFMGSAALLFALYTFIRKFIRIEVRDRRVSDTARILLISSCLILFMVGWEFSYEQVYSTPYFFWLGMRYPGFYSADWFPLIPWIFIYIAGAAIGLWVKERRFPAWFYEKKIPFFAAAGRRTLIIYLAHQPVLFGLTMLVKLLI